MRVGIFANSMHVAENKLYEVFQNDKILSISRFEKYKNRMEVYVNDGTRYTACVPAEGPGSMMFDIVYVHIDIKDDILNNVIFPMVHTKGEFITFDLQQKLDLKEKNYLIYTGDTYEGAIRLKTSSKEIMVLEVDPEKISHGEALYAIRSLRIRFPDSEVIGVSKGIGVKIYEILD